MIFRYLAFDLQENEIKIKNIDVSDVLTEAHHDPVQHLHELLSGHFLAHVQPREVTRKSGINAGHHILEGDEGGLQIFNSRNNVIQLVYK